MICFFHLNFLNAQGILAQKIYNVHAIFCQFSDVINGKRSQQPSVLCQLVTLDSWLLLNPNTLELAVLRKANLIF